MGRILHSWSLSRVVIIGQNTKIDRQANRIRWQIKSFPIMTVCFDHLDHRTTEESPSWLAKHNWCLVNDMHGFLIWVNRDRDVKFQKRFPLSSREILHMLVSKSKMLFLWKNWTNKREFI